MRRIVFIGCGGSGNAVIGYLMDHLKAALHERGHESLPAAWQFLVIDARRSPEALPDGLGTVTDQGAEYLAVSPASGTYQVVDEAVARRAQADMVTWAPRHPEQVTVPIQDGAGQMRSVGRVLLASQAQRVREALVSAADRTRSTKATSDAAALAEICGPLDGGNQPMAIVVSSMAGGSGASMALDVCRLLGDAYNVADSALFAFTPDIFDSLPPNTRSGVRPNSLAMLGEMVAMQLGEGREPDQEFMEHLGLSLAGTARLPVRRIIPVGRYASDGTPFGDGTALPVYRALGSALAALVMSAPALRTYVQTVIENATPTPSTSAGLFGWGAQVDALQWGSIGYASLSMGRDRYAEYAAQRLARTSADHLLRGHLTKDDEPGDVQVQQILDSQLEHVRRRLGLPAAHAGATPDQVEADVRRWLSQEAFPQAHVTADIRPVVLREVLDLLPERGEQATDVANVVRKVLQGRRTVLAQKVEDIAYRAAYRWKDDLVRRIEQEVISALARNGAVYARAVLGEIGAGLVGPWGEKGLRDLGGKQKRADETPTDVDGILGRLVGAINDLRSTVVDPIGASYGKHLLSAVYGRIAQLVANACAEVEVGVVKPLDAALQKVIVEWEREVADRARAMGGLSVTQTDAYQAWPADDDEQVARRWFTAQNEVLLTNPAIFSDRYAGDLTAAAVSEDGTVPMFADARARTVGRILSGEWPTTAGRGAPGSPLVTERAFVSRSFQVDPEDRLQEARTAQPGQYRLTLSPASLLQRTREFVERPDASFSTFVSGTIQDFARTAEGGEAIKRGFSELLNKAQPLAQVDEHTYTRVHGDSIMPAVNYTFSEIPFEGMNLADDLARVIRESRSGPSTLTNFTASLSDAGKRSTKISAFGYFPCVIPPVFDNILKPVRDQWASARVSDSTRRQFWSERRARPLTGALALSQNERQALIGGWFVGQIVGLLQLPPSPYLQAVRVFETKSQEWVDFPHPMLYSPGEFVRKYEWLPAVLEAHLLALADFGVDTVRGSSLRPYQALRALWDANSDQPTNVAAGMVNLAAQQLLSDWLETGDVPHAGASRCQGASRAERRENAEALLQNISHVAAAEGRAVHRENSAVFRDLAADLPEVIRTIQTMLTVEAGEHQLADDVF